MHPSQFLALMRAAGPWKMVGTKIRAVDDGGCPVARICTYVTGVPVDPEDHRAGGQILGMMNELVAEIAGASDSVHFIGIHGRYGIPNPLRGALLRAANLTEADATAAPKPRLVVRVNPKHLRKMAQEYVTMLPDALPALPPAPEPFVVETIGSRAPELVKVLP